MKKEDTIAPKTKILICIDWFAPGYKAGGPISSCVNFIKALEDVFDIYILTTDTDLGETKPYPGITANTWLPFSHSASVLYLSKQQMRPNAIRHYILAIQPDFLYLNSLFSPYFSLLPLLLRRLNLVQSTIVLSPRGMLRESALRYKSYKKTVFLTIAKLLGLYNNVWFHATDEQEVKDIKKHFSKISRVQLIPNLSKAPASITSPIEKLPNQLRCVFIGRIHPIKNLLFFLLLLKDVQASQFELGIIGNIEDAAYWQKCQDVIKALPDFISVQHYGSVPSEVIENYLVQYHFLVLPTLGENFGHAIFESLLIGRPVILSDQTPWRNLQKQKVGYDISLQESQQWLEALYSASQMDQATYNVWVESARLYAKQYLDKSASKEKYIAFFRN